MSLITRGLGGDLEGALTTSQIKLAVLQAFEEYSTVPNIVTAIAEVTQDVNDVKTALENAADTSGTIRHVTIGWTPYD